MTSKEKKEKLTQIVDFRVGRGAKEKYPIEEKFLIPAPSTDGKKIFIPQPFSYSEEMLIDTVRHEADHIKEMEDLSREISGSSETGPAKAYIEGFFWREAVAENPTLAFEILNIVWDNSIDVQAREGLLGSRRIFETEKPEILTRRPSTKFMFSDLDKFRELFLQKSLIGETKENVPEKWQKLLDECVGCVKEAGGDDIPGYLKATEKIYQRFKENFDIRQKLLRLPALSGRGGQVEGFRIPQNYRENEGSDDEGQGKTKEAGKEKEGGEGKEEGKEEGRKEGKEQDKRKDGAEENKSSPKTGWINEDRDILNPALSKLDDKGEIGEKINKHSGEIERMIKVFRQLKQEALLPKRAKEGQEIDIDEYIQTELKKEATGIDSDEPMFIQEQKRKPNPGWAVLQDISISTEDILNELKATSIILAETLKRSNYLFGLFAFNSLGDGKDTLYTLKDFNERYSMNCLGRILELKSSGNTGMADSIKYLTEKLTKFSCYPKGLIVVTDGEPNRLPPVKRAIEEANKRGIIVVFVCIACQIPPIKQIVKEYILISRDEINKLPQEMLKIFKKYRLAR